MMYYSLFFVTIFAIASVEGDGINNAMTTAVSDINELGLWLTYNLLHRSEENFVFSPYSISKGMTVLHAGAKGATRAEIGKHFVRSFENNPDEYYAAVKDLENEFNKLNENIIFVRGSYGLLNETERAVNKKFVKQAKKDFNTEIRAFNKSNVNTVVGKLNREIAESLRSSPKIANSLKLERLEPDTVGVLYNYVYLKGNWSTPFPDGNTEPGTFSWTEKNEKCQASIPMMQRTSDEFLFMNTDKYTVLGIPFKGEQLALFIVMNNTQSTLPQVLFELRKKDGLADVMKNIKSENVEVTMPKFELSGKDLDLKSFLERIGIKKLFTSDSDLSGIVPGNTAFVSAIKHKAFLKIDENGGEAGGATVFEIGNKFGGVDYQIFKADRPFLFVIGHRLTGAVLFQGIYRKPQVPSSEWKCTKAEPNPDGIAFPEN